MVVKMYEASSFLTIPNKISLPECMYSMKSLSATPTNVKQIYYSDEAPQMSSLTNSDVSESPNASAMSSCNKSNMNLASLKEGQLQLLKTLTDLKENLEKLQSVKQLNQGTLDNDTHCDIVISANPSRPPYFLLPLREEYQCTGRVLLTSSVHSSVNDVPKQMALFKDDQRDSRSTFNYIFTVLWKDQPNTTLMVNPLNQIEIKGESNILRYLSRTLPKSSGLNYEHLSDASKMDETDYMLDSIQSKLLQGNSKEQQSFLKLLNSRLGASKWILDGQKYGLCDVFAWSSILQLSLQNSLPSNVSAWFKRLREFTGFSASDCDSKNGTPMVAGSNKYTREGLEQFLKENNIKYQCKEHQEVFTVEAMMECVSDLPGMHMKNLFLKDKKKNYYLMAAKFDTQVNLSKVAKQIGSKDLRFGDEDTMFELLGVKQGCVTLFALINDKDHLVTPILDSRVKSTDEKFVNFHPLTNSATLGISPEDALKFLELTGHKPKFVNF